jgi:uncharacterized membrane protein YtjA (UPF0391 family)
MLKWALIFLIIALIAATFGFSDIAATASSIAKIMFGIFIFLFFAVVIAGIWLGNLFTR